MDWKCLSGRLKEHESSVEHLTNMNTWNELRSRLSKNQSIDDDIQQRNCKGKREMETGFGKNIFCSEVSCQT